MSQERTGSDELLGKYLSKWTDELQDGNEPKISDQALQDLSMEQIAELLAIARFTKALEFPSDPGSGRSKKIKVELSKAVYDTRRQQLSAGRAIVESAKNFGECLSAARRSLKVTLDQLSKECGIPRQVLEDVETGSRSPIRIQPVDRMTILLVSLSIGIRESIALIKKTAEAWASESFKVTPTQLGRMNRQLSSSERRRLLNHNDLNDVGSDLERELARISQYVHELEQSIGAQ